MEQKSLTLRECLIGDRTFYRHVAVVVLPIIVQNTLSNVVSLLDNVMVGQVGTLPMSAVAIINQLLFVFNLCIWGALAGAGIFGAQYYGQGNAGVSLSQRKGNQPCQHHTQVAQGILHRGGGIGGGGVG